MALTVERFDLLSEFDRIVGKRLFIDACTCQFHARQHSHQWHFDGVEQVGHTVLLKSLIELGF